jgi:hypothetical protein
MKNSRSILYVSLFVLLLLIVGCKDEPPVTGGDKPATPATDSGTGPPAPATAGAPATPGNPPTGPTLPPAVFRGRYIMSEVRHDGEVSMVDPANATQIIFTQTGAYVRQSKRRGIVDHSDSGDFRVENDSAIVLRTQMSDGKLKIPPTEKRYEFILSSSGDELILKGSEGREAVFRRQQGNALGR